MKVIRLLVHGSFNSFRVPREIKYHRTLYIPTKTTLVGLLGAAVGIEQSDLESLYNEVKCNAVLSYLEGVSIDTWTITKLKTQGKPESAIIIREALVHPVYWIYYQLTSSALDSDKIKNAFLNPRYPLTLGRSDELILVKSAEVVTLEKAEDSVYRNTILPFDYRKVGGVLEERKLQKGETIDLPQVFTTPTSFLTGKREIRIPAGYMTVTAIFGIGMKLREPGGWRDGERCFFLY